MFFHNILGTNVEEKTAYYSILYFNMFVSKYKKIKIIRNIWSKDLIKCSTHVRFKT